jgi:hypothetical protein
MMAANVDPEEEMEGLFREEEEEEQVEQTQTLSQQGFTILINLKKYPVRYPYCI